MMTEQRDVIQQVPHNELWYKMADGIATNRPSFSGKESDYNSWRQSFAGISMASMAWPSTSIRQLMMSCWCCSLTSRSQMFNAAT